MKRGTRMLDKGAAWTTWYGDAHPIADMVHEQDKPEESKLLGPDGRPLKYQRQPMGFDLRKRDA